MKKIFISYKRTDRDKVFALKDRIEAAVGEQCWIDLQGIGSAAAFTNSIISAINACDIMLFMYSAQHAQITDHKKDWTIKELEYAQKRNKRIVFVNIDGSPLTDWFEFNFGPQQQVDARSDEAVERLCSDIRLWLASSESVNHPASDKEQSSSSLAGPSVNKQVTKKRVIAGIAVFLSVLLIYLLVRFTINRHQQPELETDAPVTSAPAPANPSYITQALTIVDLGLPSGTLWANMNVGAKLPTDYGWLYAWGETHTKLNYSERTYHDPQLNNEFDFAGDSLYDAATAELGYYWMLPDAAQFKELIAGCEWSVETYSNVAGLEGTSIVNGQRIFFPMAGRQVDDDIRYRGTTGYYWTTDLQDSDRAWNVVFEADSITPYFQDTRLYFGRSIRPVFRQQSDE